MNSILLIILAPLWVIHLYLLLITLTSWLPLKKNRKGGRLAEPHVTLVIPAHNEACSIQQTVREALKMNYPADRFHVLVLADNCDDETAVLAGEAGADVVERFDPENRGKGQALDWLFTKKQERFDGTEVVALIDADTIPDPDFLEEGIACLDEKHPVVQGYYGVSNPEASWRTKLNTVALTLVHHVRQKGLNGLGVSAGLKGNGMLFDAKLLLETGWPAGSIVEDLELTLALAEKGHAVSYAEKAIVLGEMPASASNASSQRVRWEMGRFQIIREYGAKLVQQFLKKPTFSPVILLLELVTPPLAMLVMLDFMLLFLTGLLSLEALILTAGMTLAVSFYVGSGILQKRLPVNVVLSLAFAPAYILWKLPVLANALIRKTHIQWSRTRREGETVL